jgi:hypothetical protein
VMQAAWKDHCSACKKKCSENFRHECWHPDVRRSSMRIL